MIIRYTACFNDSHKSSLSLSNTEAATGGTKTLVSRFCIDNLYPCVIKIMRCLRVPMTV
jgi:hypothetical protein